jgi:dTDP-4-amino-4,6-dideoxygalactose transaminase
MSVIFNRPHVTGRELGYIQQAIDNAHLSGNGPFARRCQEWLEARTGTARSLLTNSATAALEMAALLIDAKPGDEIIMPSFTFVSTANAFVLRGAVPVFVEIREDTLNLDERLIEPAITPRTTAIAPVHYAGVGCEMDAIMDIARRYGLRVVEDAAQCLLATYRGKALGGIGDLGALSFHETKNIHCGEGGAILVNDPGLADRADILQEKGTNRRQFFRGQVDKYSWIDVGSSFLPSEISAAFLTAQLEDAEAITARRMEIWEAYHAGLADLEARGVLRRPVVPADRQHNAHLYYILMPDLESRTRTLKELNADGVNAVFHYVPLHSAQAGQRFGRASGDLRLTTEMSERLIRLPLWPDLSAADVERVIETVRRVTRGAAIRH